MTVPLAAPALAASWLLAFTLSLDDVVLASFVSGPAGTTLPVAVFSRLRLGMTPEVNALAALLLGAAVAGMAAWLCVGPWLRRRRGTVADADAVAGGGSRD